jgi:alanyl-tRNA synthetase
MNHNCLQLFQKQCEDYKIPFEDVNSVLPYDESTLFCPAGMQKYKKSFSNQNLNSETVSNVQSCIRLNDIDNAGDGVHSIAFRMIGLFSFRHWSISETITFFHEYITFCGIKLSHVTIHPDKFHEWNSLHPVGVDKIADSECKWSDGEIGGYCTEFYALDRSGTPVEIGNIVNPLGDCIDVGFGLERLDKITNNIPSKSRLEELTTACDWIINSGVRPSNVKQGYILRKLLRMIDREGGVYQHEFFQEERLKLSKIKEKYENLKHKFLDKSEAWWWDTHGIRIGEDV